jgi:hypothetical protein
MDDLELEARLRTRLHRRFDEATPSPDLAASVRQGLTTQHRRVGFTLRTLSISLGWAAAAAVVFIAVAVLGIGKGIGPAGPGAAATPTAQATAPPERWFVVVPPSGTVIAKPDFEASDVLAARLRALGFGNFASTGDYGIEYQLPAGDPPDDVIRAVLAATGDVRIVPLPPADYGAGKLTAVIGQPLPKDEPTLFGWDGIVAAAMDPQLAAPELSISLGPAAAQAFGDYTQAHLGETFAIIIDGRVAVLPTVSDAVANGLVAISSPGDASFRESAAILTGGILPEAWRGATSPVLISEADAVAAALAATHGGTVTGANPNVERAAAGGAWQAVWTVTVHQPDCGDNERSCVSPDYQVALDGVAGTVITVSPIT